MTLPPDTGGGKQEDDRVILFDVACKLCHVWSHLVIWHDKKTDSNYAIYSRQKAKKFSRILRRFCSNHTSLSIGLNPLLFAACMGVGNWREQEPF
jgi:hypothetical protein